MKIVALLSLFVAGTVTAEPWETFSDTWMATDALGRKLPGAEEVGAPRKDRFVGMFYYVWHGAHGYAMHSDPEQGPEAGQGVLLPDPVKDALAPFDITQILSAPADTRKWGPEHRFHHWGEPLFGYYVANDEWVIRHHAQMLVDAGVDVVLFDATNGFHYRDIYMNLCRVYMEIRAEGGRTPQIAFLCNGSLEEQARNSATALYRDLYQPGKHKDLWFFWKGKPLILGMPKVFTKEMKKFFTIRNSWAWSHNPNTGQPMEWFGDGKDCWNWLDTTPQAFGWHKSASQPEQVPVSPAEHPHRDHGKSHHNGEPMHPPSPGEGLYFSEQWNRALELDPEFILITQWNEWVAQRFINDGPENFNFKTYAGKSVKSDDTVFIDAFTSEYNRDLEPMMGGYGDNYYYQMIANIRRFKGVRKPPFEGRTQRFYDSKYDTTPRDHFGWGGVGRYVDTTGRNDFQTAQVKYDSGRFNFAVQTVEPITPPAGENWMELFIAVDKPSVPTWEGYQYRIRLEPEVKQWYIVEESLGGFQWRGIGKVEYEVSDRVFTLSIPRDLLPGMDAGFRFKWSDNRQTDQAIDWLRYGDAAPNGRFQYEYRIEGRD